MISTAAEVNRAGAVAKIFGIATFLTGLGLVFYRGGFKAVSPTIHMGMTLVLIMIILGFVLHGPTGKKLTAAAQANDVAAWTKNRKKWSMGEGIMQLLWTVTLVLMFIKIVR